MLEMQVVGIAVDPNSGGAVLMLQDEAERTLAICIGLPEATAIAKELEGVQLPRPLTHDLLRATIEHLGASLQRIEVVDLRDNTYFAELVLIQGAGPETRLDCRPSDAIALAVRAQAPIFVHEEVLKKAGSEATEMPAPTDKEGWRKLLEQMSPEDFGKYKM
jgi:bifunctional DNase/RNase